jgi:hypothetical protein
MKNELIVDGVKYVRADSVPKVLSKAECRKGMPYVIVRSYKAGVFAGFLAKRVGQEATVLDARRLWYWKGAASLSQLAVDGVSKPNECKFPVAVPKVELTEVIEILQVSQKAKDSIAGVPEWKS